LDIRKLESLFAYGWLAIAINQNPLPFVGGFLEISILGSLFVNGCLPSIKCVLLDISKSDRSYGVYPSFRGVDRDVWQYRRKCHSAHSRASALLSVAFQAKTISRNVDTVSFGAFTL
jgi:hypothetical protein